MKFTLIAFFSAMCLLIGLPMMVSYGLTKDTDTIFEFVGNLPFDLLLFVVVTLIAIFIAILLCGVYKDGYLDDLERFVE